MTIGTDVLLAVLSALFAAGGAYAAVRVELRFVWRELGRIDRALERLGHRPEGNH